ncbi:hypothetical protein JCM8547_000780 [Rhodosporidiobolus lusitaniae]
MASHTALDSLVSRFRPRSDRSVAVLAVPAAAVALFALVYRDYTAWLDFHPGGTPPTWQGYGKMSWLRLRRFLRIGSEGARDLRDGSRILPEANEKREGGLEEEGWLRGKDALPTRQGERPEMMSRPLPQRQKPQALPEELKKRLFAIIPSLHAQRPDLVSLNLSVTEGKSSDALFTRVSSPPPEAEIVKKELAHVHPADNSLHLLLAPQDAKEVVEKGWGERFVIEWVSSGWVMLYAPRTEGDLEVVERIVRAAVSFGTCTSII